MMFFAVKYSKVRSGMLHISFGELLLLLFVSTVRFNGEIFYLTLKEDSHFGFYFFVIIVGLYYEEKGIRFFGYYICFKTCLYTK